MIRTTLFAASMLLAALTCLARGLDPDDLASLSRLSDPQVSPDGSAVAYVLTETDLKANERHSDLWLLNLHGRDASPRRLTDHEENDNAPQWSPDGKFVYFISSRSGSSQIWRVAVDGGRTTQVTDYPVGVANLLLAPDGSRIAFTAEVFPGCEKLSCTAERLSAEENENATGKLFDRTFVRHWDSWEDGRRSALFSAALGRNGKAAGEPAKVSRKLDGDVPSVPFGGREEIAFSPDGATLFFALREAGRSEPWSTNLDIFRAPADGSALPENLTSGNDATDTHPVVSPDGRSLAWMAMSRPGYESDQYDVMIRNLEGGETRSLTEEWDRSVSDLAFSDDGASLYVTAGDTGTRRIFRVGTGGGAVEAITSGFSDSSVRVTGERLVFVRDSFASPADLWSLAIGADGDSRGQPTQLTTVNAAALDDVEMATYEQFSFAGAGNDTVYGYVFRPVQYEERRRYPIAFLIHGGPQGSFGEGWSYRWNPQTYAALGYAVVTIDFHGSSGYGQEFVDSINRDWGGKPLVDLQKGLAAALEQYPWLDGNNACALGASYGGYMINWIAGNWPDRFECLVNHDGLFDLRSFYYATEELWFPEWDFGAPYYEDPEAYEQWNPARHVAKWRTPMLVIHGQNDYRVPIEQGLGAFTALQRQNIPSKLLVFPDENHWVLSAANSIQWHETVAAWLAEHLDAEEVR